MAAKKKRPDSAAGTPEKPVAPDAPAKSPPAKSPAAKKAAKPPAAAKSAQKPAKQPAAKAEAKTAATTAAKPAKRSRKTAPIEAATTSSSAAPAAAPAAATAAALPDVPAADLAALLAGESAHPHAVLGEHPATVGDRAGVVVRALAPNAVRAECLLDDRALPMTRQAEGLADLYAAFVPDATAPLAYRLRFHYADGAVWERDDPYRFLPTLGDVDLHLFNEGTHRELWKKLGAHVRTVDGVRGTSFAVWAPNARRVSVVGDFCGWDGRVFPMRMMGSSGVWELFVPEIGPGALYKFELLTREHAIRVKTDPFAAKMEQYPGTASIVVAEDAYAWGDAGWIASRASRDPVREPMSIYEVHLGSWARVPEEGGRMLTYAEIAPRLAEHVASLGFTHVELLPIMEHPFYGSWGYQVSGYFAPTSRYGTPDEFRHFVDTLHRRGIGVILDWVPAHFPKDDYALRRFDGTALFEHDDPRMGEHPDWGTLIFNYGRNEVRNFLIANALYWVDEFHVDGLRVDAVASMLYLDYSRKAGEWVRNRHGGRENLDAIAFLQRMNETVQTECPGVVTIAEESTAWPGVTTPVRDGGLGFTFKWNMGWMHDTLDYFARDPVHRRFHQDQLTFAMLYEYSERFIMPLSHDEVVHLKGSLVSKMAGDEWQKFANLRALLAYMFTRPGKKLLFMGTELAPWGEWNHDASLDWHLRDDGLRAGLGRFVARLAHLYRERAAFWREDAGWDGFAWIDVADRENSVISYARRAGGSHAVVVLNLTPVPRERYRVGLPAGGTYERVLSTDDLEWGGSGFGAFVDVAAEATPFHGQPWSAEVALPPLAVIVLAPRSA